MCVKGGGKGGGRVRVCVLIVPASSQDTHDHLPACRHQHWKRRLSHTSAQSPCNHRVQGRQRNEAVCLSLCRVASGGTASKECW